MAAGGSGRRRRRRGRRRQSPISTFGNVRFLGWRRRVRRHRSGNPPPGADRTGLPTPLLFHLASAALILEKGVALSPLAGTDRFPWTGPCTSRGQALGPVEPVDVTMAATGRLRSFLDGIEAWQRHPHRRAMPEPSVLWQEGGARLLDFGGDGPAIVAIPSLINRAYILDLGPETSLMRFLARSGLRALLLDWGLPGPAESGFDLTAYYDLRLAPALAAAQSLGRPLALLGYCMGGALAVAAAQLQGPRIARIALIGTPWSFAGGTGSALMLRGLAREYGLDRAAHYFMGLDQAFGAVPYDFIQLLFALLDPGLALAKFRRFAALDPASAAARRFVEVEDWLNDAVPLTGPAAVEMLLDWQVRNLTGAGEWRLAGQRIRPETLRLPALAFCSAIDRIAPPEATEALPRAIPGARILRPGTGHVGMIVGRRARSQVWDPLRDFLAGA